MKSQNSISQPLKVEKEQFLGYWREMGIYGEDDSFRDKRVSKVSANEKLAALAVDDSLAALLTIADADAHNDHSFVLLANGEPLMGCKLFLIEQEDGKIKLGCGDGLATTYLNSRMLDSKSHNVSALALEKISVHLSALIEKLQPDVIEFKDALKFGLLSPVTQSLIMRGGAPLVSYATLIDVKQPYRTLLRSVTPSVRCYIQQSLQQCDFDVKPQNCQYSRAAVGGSESEMFQVKASREGDEIATAQFSCHQDQWSLEKIKAVPTELSSKTVLYGLVWAAVSHLNKLGEGQLVLDHGMRTAGDHELNFTQLGGKLRSEMTVTLCCN